MANRKQRRHGVKPQGMSYADILTRKRQLWDACQQAANDTMVQVQSDIHTQRRFHEVLRSAVEAMVAR